MHDTGLSDEGWELIRSVLAAHPDLTQVKLFGSRAKGNAKNQSQKQGKANAVATEKKRAIDSKRAAAVTPKKK